MITFQNSFAALPDYLYEKVNPTPLTNPKLIHVTKLFKELDLGLTEDELVEWLNGQRALPGEQRIASRYAGHQFGVWAGQLGDGRAISLGEIIKDDKRFEIQTKGSGLTPFSRMGDGKAVIRSSVREYLCSEALSGLNIPTTRVLGLITGSDPVYREKVEKSALVARVFPSNLRFGHFELCFHFEKDKELDALIKYTQETFFKGLSIEEMLREVVSSTAKLIAHWQNVGFCHGVMNTDNMSVLGLTIDYGPFGFLEDTNLGYICNHSDHEGRYAYSQQPSIGMWNLERLLVCFMKHVPKEKLQEILNEYPAHFEKEYVRLSREKLGLLIEDQNDYQLIVSCIQMLSKLSIDYTFFFRKLAESKMSEVLDYYGKRDELLAWLKTYESRLELENSSAEERSERMKKSNPKYVLKNYIAQEIIDEVERGESKKLNDFLEVFYNPYDEHEAFNKYSLPTPPEHKNYVVSCSS